MINSLYDEFIQLDKSYYQIPIYAENLFGPNAKVNCFYFINEHFYTGEKGSVFDLKFKKKYENEGKHIHTVSLYLMGLIFKDQFEKYIKLYLEELIPGASSWADYEYVWFLISLYHDVASCVELWKLGDPSAPHEDTLEDYLRKIGIKHIPYSEIKKLPIKNNKKLSEQYFKYRITGNDGQDAKIYLDHGIHGGYLFYDKLYKNYIRVRKHEDSDYFIRNNLIWRREHITLFAIIADVIIKHNMFTVLDSDTSSHKKHYENDKMFDLIIDGEEKKITYQIEPLHFLLCFFDSIEPIKRFQGMEPAEVLDHINIKTISKTIISIEWDDNLKKASGFDKWLDNITTLDGWMHVKTMSAPDHNQVNIEIL